MLLAHVLFEVAELRKLRVAVDNLTHPCPRDTLFLGTGCMENSFTGCLGKV